tara:strand:+ start:74 stop:541 length:468 start_codon:yes stop_codon:yes gene_type:complete
MKMEGEYTLPTNVENVWQKLNDPIVLKNSIPGCTELTKENDNEFKATVTIKIGPVSAKFNGEVKLSNIKVYQGYTISGSGKGGAAGFAKGSANIVLEKQENSTILKYSVEAQIGGKLAQLGSRLIDSTSKKLAGKFFDNFVKIVDGATQIEEEKK